MGAALRGTDLTEAQIQSARIFANARRKGELQEMPDDGQLIVQKFGDMARLLAWYGALRFKAGRDGTGGTLEEPGPLDVKAKGASE